MKRSKMSKKSFAIPSQRKYPIDTMARARNAIARVQQHGSPSEKRKVYSAVKKKYPSLAGRSRVIPTRSGPGRRVGQRPTRAGGSSVPGTVRRRKSRGGASMARRSRSGGGRRRAPRAANGRFTSRRGGGRRRTRASGRRVKR